MPDISLEQAKVLDSLLMASREQGSVRVHGLRDIEDLHRLATDQPKLEALGRSFPSTIRQAKRLLGLPVRPSKLPVSSAIVEAALTKKIQVRGLLVGRHLWR